MPDVVGPRRTAVAAATCEAVGLSVVGVASSLPAALAGAVVTGFGFSVLFPSLALIVVNEAGPAGRGAALGTFTAFFDIGVGVGGLVAGAIAGAAGYPAVFWAAAALAPAAPWRPPDRRGYPSATSTPPAGSPPASVRDGTHVTACVPGAAPCGSPSARARELGVWWGYHDLAHRGAGLSAGGPRSGRTGLPAPHPARRGRALSPRPPAPDGAGQRVDRRQRRDGVRPRGGPRGLRRHGRHHHQAERHRDRAPPASRRRPEVRIVGSTYPDVILGAWVNGYAASQTLARLSVVAFQSLIDKALRQAYRSAGGRFVDVTAASGAYVPFARVTTVYPYGSVPVAVARVCELTYYCAFRDIHLRTDGYRLIAERVARQLP
ncbi:MAG TPA: MFS transporter, partial [Thermoleophilaceae bacterium]|nr:MFS transporter [Thermoleophilaceae bacterium]